MFGRVLFVGPMGILGQPDFDEPTQRAIVLHILRVTAKRKPLRFNRGGRSRRNARIDEKPKPLRRNLFEIRRYALAVAQIVGVVNGDEFRTEMAELTLLLAHDIFFRQVDCQLSNWYCWVSRTPGRQTWRELTDSLF